MSTGPDQKEENDNPSSKAFLIPDHDILLFKERLEIAMEVGRMDWWEWDIASNQILSSLGKRKLFNLNPDLNVPISAADYARQIHKDDFEKVSVALNAHLEGKTRYYDAEYRVYDNEGQLRWLHDRGMVAKWSDDGKPVTVIGLVQDITPYKKVENELLKAKRDAEEADRLKTAFLTNMSHEIRTPMNAIIGFSELLTDPDISREDLSNYTRIIKDRCSHLLQIVNDILDISRIESNQVELKKTMVNINNLLDDLYLFYAQRLIDEKKYRILLNLEKSVENYDYLIETDEVRLRQVIGNLLDNALKFTIEGKIEFGYRILDSMVVFHVCDTGIGIPVEKHEVIFERFRQADSSLIRQYGGNGLGLAICKAFVELMGGKIWLESKIGAGSAFYFTIPCNYTGQREANKTSQYDFQNYNWKGKRILLVEDDQHSVLFMKELFKLTHVELTCTATAEETIEFFRNSQKIDLVLMDVQLPDKSGLEVTRILKEIDPHLPVIAQSAYAMTGDNIKCLQAGCDDYVSKPINICELFTKINKYIVKHY